MCWTTKPDSGKDRWMESDLLVQGRRLRREEIGWLAQWVADHPQWSRKRLARELCGHWGWRDHRGRLKDFAARSLLLKLEAQGHLRLPPLQLPKRRAPRPVPRLSEWQQPPAWEAGLSQIRPVHLEPISAGSAAAVRWAFYLDQYHYLKLRVVGENLGYLAVDTHERDVAAVLFGAPAWRCAPRDEFLEWGDTQRREQLHRLANNTRFLILPWVRVPHLASYVLGAAARRISGDQCIHRLSVNVLDYQAGFWQRPVDGIRFIGSRPSPQARRDRLVGAVGSGSSTMESQTTGARVVRALGLAGSSWKAQGLRRA